jgi:hypothetical protein
MTLPCPDPESPDFRTHAAACPACARLLDGLDALEDLLPAALARPGGQADLPRTRAMLRDALRAAPRRRAFRAGLAAAALLLAAGGLWVWQAPTGPSAPEPPHQVPAPRSFALGREDRDQAWLSGRGVSVVISAGGRVAAETAGPGVSLTLSAGALWAEAPPDAPFRIATSLGTLSASGASLWMALEAAPERPLGALLLREARAGGPARLRLGLASGTAVWEGGAESVTLAAGESLTVDPAGARRGIWEPSARDRIQAWILEVRGRGWVDLLAPEGRARLDASVPLPSNPLPGKGSGPITLKGAGETDWIGSALPPEGRSYVMELSARVSGPSTRAALAYRADGRLPLVDLDGNAWQQVRVVHAPAGTEIWIDGACVRRFEPGTFTDAPLRAHGLARPGLVLWHGGSVEIRSWRVKLLEETGTEAP